MRVNFQMFRRQEQLNSTARVVICFVPSVTFSAFRQTDLLGYVVVMIYKTSFTAGFASLTKSLNLISFNLAFLLALNKVPYSTMSAWQQEKDKFLSIPLEEKRKHYRDFKTLKDIPTWKEYASTVTLPPAKPMLANCTIDDTLNSVLASKVSLYRGDITKLEVKHTN